MLILPNMSTLIAWLALTASLLASLALGANRPVTWVLVSGLLLFLLPFCIFVFVLSSAFLFRLLLLITVFVF